MTALALAAALLTPNTAAAQWTAPEQVSPTGWSDDPSLFYDAGGLPIAMWNSRCPDYCHNPGSLNGTQIALGGQGRWSAMRFPEIFSPAAAYTIRGHLGFVGAGYVYNGYDGHMPGTVSAWTGRWRERVLWRGSVGALAADTTPGGGAAVVWTGVHRRTPAGRSDVDIVVRRAGRSFGRARRLARSSSEVLSVAVDMTDRGDAVFAWSDRNAIYTRVLSRRGRLRPRALVARADLAFVMGAAIGRRGELTVAWHEGRPSSVHFARSSNKETFAVAPVLDQCPNACWPARAATGREGELFVAWVSTGDFESVYRAAALRPEGSSVQEIERRSREDFTHPRIAADRTGRAVLVSATAYRDDPPGLKVASLQPGGRFGPLERVPTGGASGRDPAPAIDPSSGRIGVAYVAMPSQDPDAHTVHVVERR